MSVKEKTLHIIQEKLKENGLNFDDLKDIFNQEFYNSNVVLSKKDDNNIPINFVTSFAIPKKEKVDIEDIIGLSGIDGKLLDILDNIYRSEVIFDNFGNFDEKIFNDSIKNDYILLERNGKYYVSYNGNHRTILAILDYYIELAKSKKGNYPPFMEKMLKNRKALKNVPVIHLNHNPELIKLFYDNEDKIVYPNDFFIEQVDGVSSKIYSLSYDKETNKYNAYYKGVCLENLTDLELIKKIKKINEMNLENDFMYVEKNHKFALYKKHIGLKGLTSQNLNSFDQILSKIKLPEMKVDYFLEGNFEKKETFNLTFNATDFGDIDVNKNEINKFINDNVEILYSKRSDNIEEIFTYFNFFEEISFKNLSFYEAQEKINTIKKLNDLILKKNIR